MGHSYASTCTMYMYLSSCELVGSVETCGAMKVVMSEVGLALG